MSYFYEDFTIGFRHTSYARTITDADHSLFCALVGYHVPLFIDEEYAQKTPYAGRICPSALIMSFSTAMTEALFRTTVVAQLSIENGRFHKPVRPGDTIRTETEVIEQRPTSSPERGLVIFRDHVLNQHNELVFEVDKAVLIEKKSAKT